MELENIAGRHSLAKRQLAISATEQVSVYAGFLNVNNVQYMYCVYEVSMLNVFLCMSECMLQGYEHVSTFSVDLQSCIFLCICKFKRVPKQCVNIRHYNGSRLFSCLCRFV